MNPAPGVYREEFTLAPAAVERTGIPAFLGYAATGPVALPDTFLRWPKLVDLLRREASLTPTERDVLQRLAADARLEAWSGAAAEIAREQWPMLTDALRIDSWPAFAARFGPREAEGHLSDAVRGFFANGGAQAYVIRLDPSPTVPALTAHVQALLALEHVADADLVCAPDVMRSPVRADAVQALQRAVVAHCETRGRQFALLDALPGIDPDGVVVQRAGLAGANAALYYPWIRPATAGGFVPPCGHVAGVIARTDARAGVHKAPANEPLRDVLDVETRVSGEADGTLNERSVNVIRAFPGRGIRVWGARTLSEDPAWAYVPVRRMFLAAARWLDRTLEESVFEPSAPGLWARITARLTEHFGELHRRGALRGATPEEAFYVRCDASTNPPSVRDAGRVVAEIGLAPALPREYVVVHIVRDADGVAITGPALG